MHPDLFSIGFLHVKTYGVFMALGFFAAWKTVELLCGKTGRTAEPLSNLMLLLMCAGVVGSRIAYVIEHWQTEFAARPADIIRIDRGGLMFYGGLILALAVFFAWSALKKENVFKTADLLAAALPLGHAFGRVGCFFYGCCYGRASAAAAAVCFPAGSPAWHEQVAAGILQPSALHSLPVLPTQLFEAAALLALFAAVLAVFRRFHASRPGLTTGAYLAGYAAIRFALEYLRGDPRAEIGPFSISQTISIGIAAAGAVCAIIPSVKGKART